ncbi:hypothetical protein LAJ57_13330, partial [Streptococcus pneumoniae]|uniref:hypothetical protein n=1 Tax=Streptococcus pneumoniae TaxID=1313 RepID=UPI001CBD8C2A
TNADLLKALEGVLPYAETETEQLEDVAKHDDDGNYREVADDAASAVEFAQGVIKAYKEQNP